MDGVALLPAYVVPPATIELPAGSHEKVTTGVVSEVLVFVEVRIVPTLDGAVRVYVVLVVVVTVPKCQVTVSTVGSAAEDAVMVPTASGVAAVMVQPL